MRVSDRNVHEQDIKERQLAGMVRSSKRRKLHTRLMAVAVAIVIAVTGAGMMMPANTATAEIICGKEEHTHSKDCYNEEGELVCGKEEHVHTSDCYEKSGTLTAETEDGTAVQVSYDAGVLHQGTALTISDPDEQTIKTDKKAIEEAAGQDFQIAAMYPYTLTFTKNGNKVEPDGDVSVTMSFRGAAADSEETVWKLYHIYTTENAETKAEEITEADNRLALTMIDDKMVGTASFRASSFSDYVLTGLTKASESAAESAGEVSSKETSSEETSAENTVKAALEEGSAASDTSKSATDTAASTSSLSQQKAAAAKVSRPFRAPAKADGSVDLGDYLTGFTAYKKNGDKWVPATTFTDGEDATFSLDFTVPSGTLDTDQKTLTYSLGDNVVLPDEGQSGNVTQNGKTVGTYSISKDGKVTITLNDDYDTHTAFKGNITFEGTVKNTGGQNGSTVNFGTKDSITIKPSSDQTDLSVKKTAYMQSDGYILYTITVLSYKGTDSDITVTDKFTGVNSFTADQMKDWTVTYNGQKSTPQNQDLTKIQPTIDPNGKGWSVTLPQIPTQPDPYYGNYTISYKVKPDPSTTADGKQEVTNTAQAHDINHWPTDTTTTVLQKTQVDKSSSVDYTNKKITWTITINNSNPTHDMSQDTFKDIMTVDGTPVSLPSTIYIDHNGTKVPITVAADGSFTLPSGYGWWGTSYTITYETSYTTDYSDKISKDISNTFEYTHDGHTYTDGSNQWIQGTEKTYGVNKWDATVTNSDDKTATLNWFAAITLPDGTLEKDKIEYTDTLTTKNGDADVSGKHYTTPKLLQDMYLYPAKSDNTSGNSLVKGDDYRVYDPAGNDITDSISEDPITGFKITFTDAGLAKVQGTKLININYSSIANYEDQANKTTLTFKNKGEIPGYSHDGKWDHWKDTGLNKMSSATDKTLFSADNGGTWHANTYKEDGVTIQKKDGIIYYAVVLRVPQGTTGDMVLTDTLPAGLSYIKGSESIYMYQNEWDIRPYSDGKGDLGVTVSDPAPQSDGSTKINFSVTGYRPGDAFVIFYQAKVEDEEFWKNQSNTDKNYTNHIQWGNLDDSTTTHVEQNKNVIEKDGDAKKNEDGTWNLTYHLKVNPTVADLDPDSDSLKLTDTLTIPSDSDAKAYFDPSTIHVYQFDADMPYGMGSEISSSRYAYQYDEQTHKITITIPDELACVITYQYNATVGINDATISNTAELTGVANSSTKDDQKLTGSTSSATTTKNKMVVYKVDSNDDKIKLAGVTFKLEEYKGKSNNQEVWGQVEFKDHNGYSKGNTKTTDTNGEITFTTIDDGLKENTLYRIVETDVGNNPGYVLNTKPSYFIWKTDPYEYTKSDGTKATIEKPRIDQYANAFTDQGLGWPSSVQQSEVYLVDGTGSVNYPNVKQAVSVNKVWLNADNKDLNDPTKTATVQLWRKYTQDYTQTTEFETVTVTLHMKEKAIADTTNPNNNNPDTIIKTINVVKNDPDAKIYIVYGNPVYYQDLAGGQGQLLEKGQYEKNQWEKLNAYIIPVGNLSGDTDYYLYSNGGNEWDPWGKHADLYTTPSTTKTTSGIRDVDERASDANGNVYPEVTLTNDTNWSYMWTDLPAADSNGNKYYYYVKETDVDKDAFDVTYTNNGGIEKGTITVTNKSKTQVQHAEFNFKKQWIADDGKTVLTEWPKDIVVTLTGKSSESTISDKFIIHRDEKDTFTAAKIANQSTSGIATYGFAGSADEDGFKLKFSDLPYADADGNVYTYTLTEDSVEGYSAQYYGMEGNALTSGIANNGIVKNVPSNGYILPSTGGPGTITYVVSGALLMAAALLLYIKKRRNTPDLSTGNDSPR